MTLDEAIKYLNEFILFKKISNTTEEEAIECFKLAIKALQQPSENEKIIRVRKGTLKARTGRYVVYDVEWLKTHFNTTEAKIYGQPKERTEKRTETHARDCVSKKGHWITQWNVTHQKEYYYCSECREEFSYDGETGIKMNDYSYCPNCGSCNRGRKE